MQKSWTEQEKKIFFNLVIQIKLLCPLFQCDDDDVKQSNDASDFIYIRNTRKSRFYERKYVIVLSSTLKFS